MAYDQKNQAGRGPKQKTGAGIPSALLQRTQDPKKAPVTPPKKKEKQGFFSTVGNAYTNAYKGGKGAASTSSASQGAPGSGSRKSNKDLSVGVNAAVKAGYNYLTRDQ